MEVQQWHHWHWHKSHTAGHSDTQLWTAPHAPGNARPSACVCTLNRGLGPCIQSSTAWLHDLQLLCDTKHGDILHHICICSQTRRKHTLHLGKPCTPCWAWVPTPKRNCIGSMCAAIELREQHRAPGAALAASTQVQKAHNMSFRHTYRRVAALLQLQTVRLRNGYT